MAVLVNSTHSDSKREKIILVFDAHKHDFMNGNACYQRQIDVCVFLREKKIYLFGELRYFVVEIDCSRFPRCFHFFVSPFPRTHKEKVLFIEKI